MDAILLAAGNSLRFGKNKLLYQLDGKPMYRYILELLYKQKQDRVLEYVIVVSQYDEIFADIRANFPGVECVKNPAPELGISGSIRLGIECLEQKQAAGDGKRPEMGQGAELCQAYEKSEACLFTVADQPCLSMESLVRLEQAWQESSCGIAAAAHGEWIGNPVIFDIKYYNELKQLTGDAGGKKVLRRHMDDTVLCEIPERELEDMDTQDAVSKFEQSRKMPGRDRQEQKMKQESEQNQESSNPEVLLDKFPFLKEKGHVISIVGGGGKTTLMYTLANYYAGEGRCVVATTTTHIRRPSEYPVAENREEVARLLNEHHIVVAGVDASGNKLKMSDCMDISDYMALADVVLVEADGAKCLPCKVPIEKEPVIPKESDIVIGVMGMDTLGQPLGEICFRKERALELLAVDEQHRMTEEDMAKILSSDWGTCKGVENREYYVVLNKCDDEQRMRQGEAIRALLVRTGLEKVVCISLQGFYKEERNEGK